MATIRVGPGPAGAAAAVAELGAALGGLPLTHFVPGTVAVRKAHQVHARALALRLNVSYTQAPGAMP